ncbi:C-X-C motif chemokine 11 isoform X2 [Macaca thibetana thibetana]|uniref:C-X-C motif chemokine 11 isoform X2 n=1 Tax=Macaca thibetana thibetana TaxID=257877 RepID=UPI0021BCA6ED|nr:C-X-C motif chemokine 11 isoform X2 [Macaca thibetana thibetana]
MSVKGMAIALAMILCTTVVQGFPMFKRGRCLCIGPGIKAVKVADIEKASIIYPSNNCDKIEVIITLKENKGQRCLNPKSKQARLIIKLKERIFKNIKTYEVLEKRI